MKIIKIRSICDDNKIVTLERLQCQNNYGIIRLFNFNQLTTKRIITKMTDEVITKKDRMANARLAKLAKEQQDIDTKLFWTIPDIMRKYNISRNDLVNLIAISDTQIKCVMNGNLTKYTRISIENLMSNYLTK